MSDPDLLPLPGGADEAQPPGPADNPPPRDLAAQEALWVREWEAACQKRYDDGDDDPAIPQVDAATFKREFAAARGLSSEQFDELVQRVRLRQAEAIREQELAWQRWTLERLRDYAAEWAGLLRQERDVPDKWWRIVRDIAVEACNDLGLAELREQFREAKNAMSVACVLERAVTQMTEVTQAPDKPAPKRSTEQNESRTKLIAALTRHHRYADGGCLNLEPIGSNALARAANVSPSTASAFFKRQFKGHANYRALCRDTSSLTAALKLLNDEFAPYHLLGAASSALAAPEQDDADSD